MKIRLIILLVVATIVSCSSYKQIALKNLSSHGQIEYYSRMTKEELFSKRYIIYPSDTIVLFKKKVKTIGYRNVKTGQINIFQFSLKDLDTIIKFDSLWNVQELLHYPFFKPAG